MSYFLFSTAIHGLVSPRLTGLLHSISLTHEERWPPLRTRHNTRVPQRGKFSAWARVPLLLSEEAARVFSTLQTHSGWQRLGGGHPALGRRCSSRPCGPFQLKDGAQVRLRGLIQMTRPVMEAICDVMANGALPSWHHRNEL